MKVLQAECIIDGKNQLGEGPVWEEKLGELFWVDIEGRKLHRYRPSDGVTHAYELDQKIGCAVPAEDGSWLVGLQDGFHRLDLATGRTSLLAKTLDGEIGNRMNDGKCDPYGRFWGGTISGSGQKNGYLYTLDTDGSLTSKVSEVGCSNGLAWNADGTIMYYIDSYDKLVNAFDYDRTTGTITNRRTVIVLGEEDATPDGMSIDSEGNLWVAQWGAWQVTCWNPRTGERLAKVEVPARNVTSCAFGGENLDELYITTARVGNEEAVLAEHPLAGGIFRVKLDVKGLPVHRAKI